MVGAVIGWRAVVMTVRGGRRVRIEGPNGRAILSVEDWRTYAPPKRGDVQWKDGRSAMELAKAWFRGGVLAAPEELLTALRMHDLTRDLVLERGLGGTADRAR